MPSDILAIAKNCAVLPMAGAVPFTVIPETVGALGAVGVSVGADVCVDPPELPQAKNVAAIKVAPAME
jgi:hypothetical protein